MARQRKILPKYVHGTRIRRVSFTARYLDIILWTHLDGNGMIEDSPSYIKGLVFPHDDVTISDVVVYLQELVSGGILFPIEVDGKAWLYRRNFSKHQRVYKDEQRHVSIDAEVLKSIDAGNTLPQFPVSEIPTLPQLFSTSSSTSTSSSPSTSNSSAPPPGWWSNLFRSIGGRAGTAGEGLDPTDGRVA